MKKFFVKILLVSFPIWVLVALYLYKDPFKVLYHYDVFYKPGDSSPVTLNKDYVSTETFLQNNPTYHYEAFAFGNSRSMFYEMDTWKKYIHTDRCFHYDAAAESMLGIYRKIRFLDSLHVNMKHALLVLDYETLIQTAEYPGHLFMSHPTLSYRNWFSYQADYVKTFFSPQFLVAYVDYTLSGKVKPYMNAGFLLYDFPFDYSLKYNEMKLEKDEKIIHTNTKSYYDRKKMSVFYKRPDKQQESDRVIYDKQVQMFQEIKRIFQKNHTQYKIVINPLYDQKKLNATDLAILKNYFGENQVYDFSGINFITNDYHNYYEVSHYRPQVSRFIMGEIYK